MDSGNLGLPTATQIPSASHFLLAKARDDTETQLVESVKKKTQECRPQVEDFEIEACAEKIANEVFHSEYESSLAKILPNPKDRKLLVAIYGEKVVDRLVDVSISVFHSKL